MSTAPGTPEDEIVRKTLEERREKFLQVMGKVLDLGLKEDGFHSFLDRSLRGLGGLSLIEHFIQNEGDEAATQATEALDELRDSLDHYL